MIPTRLLPLTVTWQQPAATTDEYGNTIVDFSDPTETAIRAWLQDSTTVEQRDGRDTVRTTRLLITNELGITAHDRVIVDGRIFEVDGEPSTVDTPAGPHHLEARLLTVEG